MIDWVQLSRSSTEDAEAPVVVNVPRADWLTAQLDDRLARGEGFAVATLNLDHVVKLGRSPAFQDAYRAHDFITADGHPIVWLSRLARHEVHLVPGAELVDPIAELAARRRAPVGLVGSTQASLDRAAEELLARHDGLEIVARIAPPMGFDPQGSAADEVAAGLRQAGARVVFLALGAPKQELLAIRLRAALPGCGFVSVGAGIDFISGKQHRAPAPVRALAGEWMWRLAGDPARLAGRYGACILILPRLTWTALRARPPRAGGTTP